MPRSARTRRAMPLARSKIALASFSRQQELEADGVGVGISSRAGFDPYGAVRFLTAMGRNAELRQPANNGVDARFLDFLSSHPSTPDRLKIVRANEESRPAPAAPPPPRRPRPPGKKTLPPRLAGRSALRRRPERRLCART